MRPTSTVLLGVMALAAPVHGLAPPAELAPVPATGDPRNIQSAPAAPPLCATLVAQGISLRAETAGSPLDTDRIQTALNRCGVGRAVLLRGGGFLSGPLLLPSGVSLIVDRGGILYASRQAAVYDSVRKAGAAHCGQYDADGKSCLPLITLAPNGAGGGVHGPGTIDGQGGQPIIYPAGWAPPATCASASMPPGFPSRAMSWWDLANCVDVVNMRKLAGSTVNQDSPVLIRASGRDLAFVNLTLQNSPRAHLQVPESQNVTIWGVRINTPSDYAPYGMPRAHNTDGIDWTNARNVTIAYSVINAGDDHIAINAKAGSPTGPSENITIAHDRLYGGHGISIGSLVAGGVRNMLVDDVVIDGGPNIAAMSGLHIKANGQNGGVVEDITYRHVCIRNARRPILLETKYGGKTGDKTIVYRGIYLDDISIFNDTPKSGAIVIDGSGTSTPIQIVMRDVAAGNARNAGADLSENASVTLIGRQDVTPKGPRVAVARSDASPNGRAPAMRDCRAALDQPAPFAITREEAPKAFK